EEIVQTEVEPGHHSSLLTPRSNYPLRPRLVANQLERDDSVGRLRCPQISPLFIEGHHRNNCEHQREQKKTPLPLLTKPRKWVRYSLHPQTPIRTDYLFRP
ncbi:MAG: hypothetical protein ACK55Z_38025, partial [bacterium]